MTRARFVGTVQRKHRDRSRSLSVSRVHRERPPRSHGTVRIRESVPARAGQQPVFAIIRNFGTIRTSRTCPDSCGLREVAERLECGAITSRSRTSRAGLVNEALEERSSGASPFLALFPRGSRARARRASRDGVRAESAGRATKGLSRARGTAFALSSPSRGEREAESRLTARPGQRPDVQLSTGGQAVGTVDHRGSVPRTRRTGAHVGAWVHQGHGSRPQRRRWRVSAGQPCGPVREPLRRQPVPPRERRRRVAALAPRFDHRAAFGLVPVLRRGGGERIHRACRVPRATGRGQPGAVHRTLSGESCVVCYI